MAETLRVIDLVRVLDKGEVALLSVNIPEHEVGHIAAISYGREVITTNHAEKIYRNVLVNEESPLEFAFFIFYVKAPLFISRQWMRHRMASYSEKSLRRTKGIEFFVPALVEEEFEGIARRVFEKYEEWVARGVKKEDARAILPLSTYTEFYWGVNLRSLLNFFRLRLDKHAQKEMRSYARAVLDCIREVYPIASRYVEEAWAT